MLSSKCPSSRAHPAFLARFSVSRRRRNSWWKRQLQCLSWRFLSSPLTFQFALGVVLLDVFKVFSLARIPRLWSQDRVQQQTKSKSLTFQFRTVAATSKVLVWHRHFSSAEKKVRGWVRTRGRNRVRTFVCSVHAASSAAVHVTSHGRGKLGWMVTTSGCVLTCCKNPYWRMLLSDHWQWYPPWLGH